MKYLVAGLGNPGRDYKNTKHNTGFIVLDEIISELGLSWNKNKKFKSLEAEKDNFIFLKPQTFMNKSGHALSKAAHFYKLSQENIVIIHDDVDFPFLKWKMQWSRESAGHKGVKDIIKVLGTNDFWRVRVGIGRPQEAEFDVERYVLSKFSEDELNKVKREAPKIIKEIKSKLIV